MSTAHLLHGFIYSGKTTFAKEPESRYDAVRFSHDEWMHTLYGANPPKEQFDELYSRVGGLIWRYAERLPCGLTDRRSTPRDRLMNRRLLMRRWLLSTVQSISVQRMTTTVKPHRAA